MNRSKLIVVPCTQKKAKAFIRKTHRHHRPPAGAIFCLAVVDNDRKVRGVATVGRPVSRILDDGLTVEVNRVATDGCPNACSSLLGAARRTAFAMGYYRIITYTLPEEGGSSLRGAGWFCDGVAGGGKWIRSDGDRVNDHPLSKKLRWSSINTKTINKPVKWPKENLKSNQLFLLR